jgi:nucleotide-binding universal stress UspA family protein
MSVNANPCAAASNVVLVVADMAPASINALWRGALIAREQGAPLRVLHVAREKSQMTEAHRTLESAGKQVQSRLGIDFDSEILQGDLLAQVVTAARSAGLLVMGPRRSNPLRELVTGTQAERLIRLCRIPTLVVKRPATPGRNAAFGIASEPGRYGRVLVSADLRPEAVDLIIAAMAFSRDSQTEIFHALAAGANDKGIASDLATFGHDTAMQRAQRALQALVRSSGAQDLGAVSAVVFGDPASCVLARERATGAELVVIGKRRRGLLADFILGGVTQQVLVGSRADVLVIPSEEKPNAVGLALPTQENEDAHPG